MPYADVKYPKKWRVTECSNEELGLVVDDFLVLNGSGTGSLSSTLCKLQGEEEVQTTWGLGCTYSSGPSEKVTGTIDGKPFSIEFSGNDLSGHVSGPESMPVNGPESGSNPGSGSWTAEQGG